MRIFVAGATGALGRPVVRRLVEGGHGVTGMTRSRAGVVQGLGAEPALADALDPETVRRVVTDAKPDVVVHLLTALPARGPLRAKELDATNRLRDEGTRNLIAAAVEAGAGRMVAESIALLHGDTGSNVADEETAVMSTAPHPKLQPMVDAARSLERQVLEAPLEGIVLRFGMFYGPEVGSTEYMAKMLRRRMLPLPGGGRSVASWIHVEDAADATVAAIDRGRPREVYEVVDDEPVTTRDFMLAVAGQVGAKRPFSIPVWMAKLGGPLTAAMATTQLRVSNAKAKRELGWAPEHPTYREGVATLR